MRVAGKRSLPTADEAGWGAKSQPATGLCTMGETACDAPRVLVVSNFFPPHAIGGAEIVAWRQAKLMQSRGWHVLVFAGARPTMPPKRNSTPRRERFDDLDVVRVARSNSENGAASDFLDRTVESLFEQVLRDHRPSVVHVHNLSGLSAAIIPLAKARGIKTLVTLHDRWGFCVRGVLLRHDFKTCDDHDACHLCQPVVPSPEGGLPVRYRRDYVMSCFRQADVVIAPSRQIAADYERAGLDGTRIAVLSSGIDLHAVRARRRDPDRLVRFLCSAHLSEHKGIIELMEALRILWRVVDHRGRWRLLVAGDGPLAGRLRRMVEQEGMETAVTLVGRVPRAELLDHLYDSDVVILPSICAENEPVSLLEGIASGAALLAGRVGGIPDLIRDGRNGLLYEPREPTMLAAALQEMIATPDLVRSFSQANLALRPGFDESHTGAALAALYAADPPRDLPTREHVITCGASGTKRNGISCIQNAPTHVDGLRLRLLWRRWPLSETLAASHFVSTMRPTADLSWWRRRWTSIEARRDALFRPFLKGVAGTRGR